MLKSGFLPGMLLYDFPQTRCAQLNLNWTVFLVTAALSLMVCVHQASPRDRPLPESIMQADNLAVMSKVDQKQGRPRVAGDQGS